MCTLGWATVQRAGKVQENKAVGQAWSQESSLCPSPLRSEEGPRVGKWGGKLLPQSASWEAFMLRLSLQEDR